MINYNPETVSTDYDVCDRLYFDETDLRKSSGYCRSGNAKRDYCFHRGDKFPTTLAMRLYEANLNILGTSPVSTRYGRRTRHKFASMLDELQVDQPRWRELTTIQDIFDFVDETGFPVLIRPSYVLSGAAMNVVSNKDELEHFLNMAANVSKKFPVVVSEFIENAKEIEIDAVARNGELMAYAISEHG